MKGSIVKLKDMPGVPKELIGTLGKVVAEIPLPVRDHNKENPEVTGVTHLYSVQLMLYQGNGRVGHLPVLPFGIEQLEIVKYT